MIIGGFYGYRSGPEMKEVRERVRLLINYYKTSNMDLLCDRVKEYLKPKQYHGTKNLNVNRIKAFRDIPDGIEILIDYVDATVIRTIHVPNEII